MCQVKNNKKLQVNGGKWQINQLYTNHKDKYKIETTVPRGNVPVHSYEQVIIANTDTDFMRRSRSLTQRMKVVWGGSCPLTSYTALINSCHHNLKTAHSRWIVF